MRSLRITIAMPPYMDHPVGGMLAIYEHANRLVAAGHTVTIAHGWVTRAAAARWGLGPPPPLREPSSFWFAFDPRVELRFAEELDAASLPDADFLANWVPEGETPREKGRPILWVQGLGFLPKALEDAAIRKPGGKVCTSRWLCQVVRDLGVREGDIAYIPNGVDLTTFRVSVPFDRRPCKVAMLHHPLPVKGTDVGLLALAQVRAQIPELCAVLFGTEERPPGLPSWIEYHRRPSREELAHDVYNQSRVLICPSRSEGFYLCSVEAMACGCAIASTDIPGVRDYAEHDVTALLSPSEDPFALSGNVGRLLLDPALARRVADAGTLRAAGYGWERSSALLQAHLRKWLDCP